MMASPDSVTLLTFYFMLVMSHVTPTDAMTRKYFIVAKEIDWDYTGGYENNRIDPNVWVEYMVSSEF